MSIFSDSEKAPQVAVEQVTNETKHIRDVSEYRNQGEQNQENREETKIEDRNKSVAFVGEEEKSMQNSEKREMQDGRNIRVLLKGTDFQGNYHKKVVLQSDEGIHIIPESGEEEKVLSIPGEVLDLGETMSFGEVLHLTSGKTNGEKKSHKITVCSLEREQGNPSYEGVLEVKKTEQGFIMINEVDLETYLKYVVPSEMPSTYPQESLKAQAVCARTYAVKQIEEGRMKEYGADVDDSVEFQVYNNISAQPSTDQAVRDTEQLMIISNGKPIQSYFFSTSCGRTTTDEVWGSESPADYLKSISVSQKNERQDYELQPCSVSGENNTYGTWDEEEFREFIRNGGGNDYEKEEPWYRWKVEIPLDVLQKRTEELFPHIGKLKDIKVEERTAGGNTVILSLEGENGKTQICSEYRIRKFLSPENQKLICQNGSINSSMSLLPSSCMIIDPVSLYGEVTGFEIHGGGLGHGVGMSQNGAKCMALQGKKMEEIISTFFANVTVEPYR